MLSLIDPSKQKFLLLPKLLKMEPHSREVASDIMLHNLLQDRDGEYFLKNISLFTSFVPHVSLQGELKTAYILLLWINIGSSMLSNILKVKTSTFNSPLWQVWLVPVNSKWLPICYQGTGNRKELARKVKFVPNFGRSDVLEIHAGLFFLKRLCQNSQKVLEI